MITVALDEVENVSEGPLEDAVVGLDACHGVSLACTSLALGKHGGGVEAVAKVGDAFLHVFEHHFVVFIGAEHSVEVHDVLRIVPFDGQLTLTRPADCFHVDFTFEEWADADQ